MVRKGEPQGALATRTPSVGESARAWNWQTMRVPGASGSSPGGSANAATVNSAARINRSAVGHGQSATQMPSYGESVRAWNW